MFRAVNPATGKFVRSIAFDDDATLSVKLEQAGKAFSIWSKVPIAERCELLRKAAVVLRENVEEYASLITEEMGKPIIASRYEVQKCALVCEYYADNATTFLASREVDTGATLSMVSYRPLGALLGVMPWNFPFWQVFRFVAPNLAAGNTILLKHAPNVPGCMVAIDDIFHQAGFPEDIMIPLYIDIPQMETVVSHENVQGVSLTGSTRAGKSIAALAGKHLKKSVLELGGSDPFVILDDADIKAAAFTCSFSRIKNAGQSCIGAKRIIVVESVYDEFLEAFTAEFSKHELGNPKEDATTLGPMAREDLRNQLHVQVLSSIQAGATCILGGKIPDNDGAWYPATILTDIPKNCPAAQEELFGPVACIFKVKDEAEALALANNTPYGLGAAVFTKDLERGRRIAEEELRAGACFVNEYVKSDPRLPFGGIKGSGYGRELSSEGIIEFCNVKTVFVK